MTISNRRFAQFRPEGLRSYYPLAALLLVASAGGALAGTKDITLEKTGGFIIGGKHYNVPPTSGAPNPNRTLSCDHGYVEYFIPKKPRKTSIVLWHSSSAQVWQNRWDGGEGYKDKMLRADFPTYIWDGPRVGRANWSCETVTYTPSNRDQGNFTAWKFGPTIPVGKVPTPAEFYPGTQFPANSPHLEEYWWNATGARYDEFDNAYNIELETDAAAVAADSGKLGDQIVYLTNSAGGLRAMKTTAKTTKNNIGGIVTYESIGYVFPIGDPESPTLCTALTPACAFGPLGVPLEDFKKLAKLKKIQFVWGDNRPETEQQVILSRLCAKLINKYGGNAEVLKLGDDAGLKGSTHIPFMDMDNDKVADLLFKLLKKNKLDDYAKKTKK
ncbi:alpha/beta fold hydrolase [Hyphomicrobium sp.]|uniref:alpha/beta hydrolase n=1 Tax=Hyphomicrobium sp. TaxID=82 RepID=UPI001D5F81C1|nr:alpha/beta fold hydrolase [Hyphomicrobium sp.]MBY0562497.1 alpha/beta fold hydrolase [Hyphomicrobium sp.]